MDRRAGTGTGQGSTRGQHAFVHDVDGGYVARYYRPERGDLILNPFDARCAYWNPFSDMRSPSDADRLASFLVAKPGGKATGDDVWYDQARLVVAAVILRLWEQGRGKVPELTRALRDMSPDELAGLTRGTEASRVFQKDAEKATASVLFCLAEAAKVVGTLKAEQGEGPAIGFDAFYTGLPGIAGAKPWIFLASRKRNFAAARPLLGCWLDCAVAAILDRPLSGAPRAWLVLDELPTLPRASGLLPEAAVKAFSARGNQVEAALAERGKTRADASAAEKATVTLATRAVKQDVPREALVPSWRAQADLAGFGAAERKELVAEAERQAARGLPRELADQCRADAAAAQAVAAAARQLSERAAVFGAAALEARAGEHAGGQAEAAEIARAVARMTVREAKGQEHVMQLDHTRDRHVRHGWVGTVHGSQGATADRSMTHLERFRANTVDAKSAYVAISRAKSHAAVYTDSREKLAEAIELRSGEREAALSSERAPEPSGGGKLHRNAQLC